MADQLQPGPLARLRSRLLSWYDRNRRDLPWRRTQDPYAIWISEIMLQQTRVAAVLGRYVRFLERFPNVKTLARADVAEVLALWSGLGYYRRARGMHEAARTIVAAGGELPQAAQDWRKLPGIGRYTSAAIGSIAFGERCAVVDGNVERILRRVFGIPDAPIAEIWNIAEEWVSPKRPGDFNQAMMELGATVCLPGVPECRRCPLRTWCSTRGELPAKRTAVRVRRDSAYALSLRHGKVYLKQRKPSESLMPGLWELPEIQPNGHEPEFTVRHAITVTDFRVSVIRMDRPDGGGRWIAPSKAEQMALTGLTRKILQRAKLI